MAGLDGRLAHAVALLADAYTFGSPLPGLREECRPRDIAEGYAVQAALVAELGFETAGWKIGCTSEAARRILKADGPFAGRVFAPRCFASGARIASSLYPLRGLEGEFAFVLGRDLRKRKRPYSRAEVLAAVAELRPAIEIVQSRYDDFRAVGVPELVADLGLNGAIVFGEPAKGWKRRDLASVEVKMRAGGKIVGKGKGGDALGHPVEALRWLANNPPVPEGLAAGEIVLTGTCTGLHLAAEGVKVACDFGPVGKVGFAFV
jgi:2-keto-4-pentenoate hydratase